MLDDASSAWQRGHARFWNLRSQQRLHYRTGTQLEGVPTENPINTPRSHLGTTQEQLWRPYGEGGQGP